MVYYYAHTGHKIGLECARRGVTVIKKLQQHGVEALLLVNDFRAGVALKEQYGIREYINIETVQDIDAIAQMGDSILIDSDEDDHGRLVKYVADFKQVWRFAHDNSDHSIHGETLFKTDCDDETCENGVIVDDLYFKKCEKEERVLFFLCDYDHDKTILNHADFFQAFNMELLLGSYFFVKYEDALARLFSRLHEPEMYVELIKESTTVVTASSQAALEAKAGGAKTIFIQLEENPLYPVALLEAYGIEVIEGLDEDALRNILDRQDTKEAIKVLTPFDETPLLIEL
ncbi:hypothetical protein MNB_SV-4-399 [hydrothermal vent metagenome]|uniref:Uncharacterized protein n=1 Tax=hydrothermal vent metagenome TaxID=652676 RepID=A0A1W1EA31_9ZZZZ